MSTSSLPIRFPDPRPTIKENGAKKAADLESVARLIERAIPNFRHAEERQFYREVVKSYRLAARDILHRDMVRRPPDQDIAE